MINGVEYILRLERIAERADKLLNEILPQIGPLAVDIGNINELAMSITAHKKEMADGKSEGDPQH